MKSIVFFQCGLTQSTPWLDVIQSWNNKPLNKGYYVTPANSESQLYQFEKSENKILFNKNIGYVSDQYDFILTKNFIMPGMELNKSITRGLDINFITTWLNENEDKSLGFGAFLNTGTHVDIINHSVYYTRQPFPSGHIYDITNNQYLTSKLDERLDTVTWFYAYKVKSAPIYILVFNPSLVIFGDEVDFETETTKYRKLDQHLGDLSTQILKPKFGKNTYALDDKWQVIRGEEFTFDVGGFSVLTLALKETIDYKLLKIVSDLNIVHLSGTKYKARFKKNQYTGYISIRLNTFTPMDLTFINSKNRLVYNINITRHYEED